MSDEPFGAVPMPEQLLAAEEEEAPALEPPRRFSIVHAAQDLHGRILVPLQVLPPRTRRATVVSPVHLPLRLHPEVLIESGSRSSDGMMPPVKKYLPIQLSAPSVS